MKIYSDTELINWLQTKNDEPPFTNACIFRAADGDVREVLSSQLDEENDRVAMQKIVREYHELLWAVNEKHPDETRYETALRYIREAESGNAAVKNSSDKNK